MAFSDGATANYLLGNPVMGGDAGPDYYIQASTNLLEWQTIYTNTGATLPFSWTDSQATNIPSRFYGVNLGP